MMITYTQEELSSIVHAFAFPGTITDWTPHGNGHINDTFLVLSLIHISEPTRPY